MNVTLSIDDDIVSRARKLAARRGTSLNQMIRDFLAEATSDTDPSETIRELEELWQSSDAGSKGRSWTREELYDRPVLR